MQFLRPLPLAARDVAIFCGAFDPPTIAHLAMAQAAGMPVLWAMPQAFPHKTYLGVTRDQRLDLVLHATPDAVALTRENLFFAIADELRETSPQCNIHLLLGEDGVRRLFEWNYDQGEATKQQYLQSNLARTSLLCFRRQQDWAVPAPYENYVHWLSPHPHPAVSSTAVRECIAAGQPWQHLVPPSIVSAVSRLYCGSSGIVSGQ